MPSAGHLIELVLAGLALYGYRIVFAATVLENIFVVGSFTPGDTITAAAAVAASTVDGTYLSPWVLIAVATTGSLLGANISYAIGYRGGRAMIERVGPRFGISTKAIEATEEFFSRRGSETIFLARFVAVFKNIAPALAGASKMNLFWFELYSLLSAIVYASALVALGWFLGENYALGLKYFGAASWVMFAVIAAVGIWLWTRKRRHDTLLAEKNAAEFEHEHAEASDDDTL